MLDLCNPVAVQAHFVKMRHFGKNFVEHLHSAFVATAPGIAVVAAELLVESHLVVPAFVRHAAPELAEKLEIVAEVVEAAVAAAEMQSVAAAEMQAVAFVFAAADQIDPALFD